MMTQDKLILQIEDTAHYCRIEGQCVVINDSLPSVEVHRGPDDNYFFQGQEASDLLDECPDYVSRKDYLLWIAQGW